MSCTAINIIYIVLVSTSCFVINRYIVIYYNYRNGTLIIHCCDNREDIKGVCIECGIGYASDFGEPCHECPEGTFGKKCGEICYCSEQERCHHVGGCTNYFEEISTKDQSKTPEIHTNKGSIGKNTIIYIVCTGVITFVFTLCMVSFNRYRRKHKPHPMIPSTIQDNSAEDGATRNQISTVCERFYDEIDELQMIDIQRNANNQCNVDSEDMFTCESRNVESYLNPYQPIVPDLQHHDYRSLQGHTIMYENDNICGSDLMVRVGKYEMTHKQQYINKHD